MSTFTPPAGPAVGPPVPPTYLPSDIEALARRRRPEAGWLWQGYLAPGSVTLLTSQWKAGKTTLVSVLLSRLATGGTFAGLPLRAGRAVVVSEEAPEHWLDRHQRLQFGANVGFLCRPFLGRPRPDQWMGLIEHLVSTHGTDGLDLVVIDPLASFLPGRNENNAGGMLDLLLPLQQLVSAGVSVLVNHHPRKGETLAGQAARGSGALSGYVDIIIEMDWFATATDDDRRRKLTAFSRHSETPRRLVLELTADGADYISLGDFTDPALDDSWRVLFEVLDDATHKLTRQEILGVWPADYRKPAEVTLWRLLERTVKDGRVLITGTGRRNDPFRYWVRASEPRWANDPNRLDFLEPLPTLPPLREAMGLGPRQDRDQRRPKTGEPTSHATGSSQPRNGIRPAKSQASAPAGPTVVANVASQSPASPKRKKTEPDVIVVVVIRLDSATDDWKKLARQTARELDLASGSMKDGIGLSWDSDRSGPIFGGRAELTLVPRSARITTENLTWLMLWAKEELPWVESVVVEKVNGPRRP